VAPAHSGCLQLAPPAKRQAGLFAFQDLRTHITRMRVRDAIAPCLPTTSAVPPTGPGWLHEIKFDGYRMMARKETATVLLITKNGYDWADRYPALAEAVRRLRCTSCTIDGELVSCDEQGVPVFERLRSRRHPVQLYAFDLLELDGIDCRSDPVEARKRRLRRLLPRDDAHILYSDHIEADGELVFEQICAMGLEGIVSKRKGSPYRSGRTRNWIKTKNPAGAAAIREATEDWNKARRR